MSKHGVCTLYIAVKMREALNSQTHQNTANSTLPCAATLCDAQSDGEAGRRHLVQVPLKYANRSVTAMEYLVSFGVGAALATTLVAAAYSVVAPYLQW